MNALAIAERRSRGEVEVDNGKEKTTNPLEALYCTYMQNGRRTYAH